MEHMTKQAFETALDEHGELHVTMEEHDRELEVRQGQYSPSHREAPGVFTIWYGKVPYDFQYDRIVSWYKPKSIWHESE